MNSVVLNGKRIPLSPSMFFNEGGEAVIYNLGNGKALKIYKQPDHPDFDGFPDQQHAAQARLKERQTKLRAFPHGMPGNVIAPEDLATDANGMIVGFSMKFLKGAEVIARLRKHDVRNTIPGNSIVAMLTNLHFTVQAVHKTHTVIGDFNDLNVLMQGEDVYLIDADSFQFGNYLCMAYTQRFADPLLCDPNEQALLLAQPHTADSDWYAYAIMLMQSLLRVDPYGGAYRPKDKNKHLKHTARPLHRITVFNPDVMYPRSAMPLEMLPDDLLQHFHEVFMKDKRGEFPLALVQGVCWTTCSVCGTEHARRVCPQCAVPVAAVKERVRGAVSSRRIFKTTGTIVHATFQNGHLKYVYHHDGAFKRESGDAIAFGSMHQHMRFRIQGDTTYIGSEDVLRRFSVTSQQPNIIPIDTFRSLPMFGTNSQTGFWIENGRLVKQGQRTTEYIGGVLADHTQFWVGEKFGFGLYRAGMLTRAFVFSTDRHGINDSVNLPRIKGQLVDATAYLSDRQCWFFTTNSEANRTINRCTVIDPAGNVIATAEAEDGDDSWLGSLRGKTAIGSILLAATDEGLVRVEANGNTIAITREFPDSRGFVHAGNKLIPGDGGIYVISRSEISHLTMK